MERGTKMSPLWGDVVFYCNFHMKSWIPIEVNDTMATWGFLTE